jgi:NAD(P) transhydrogenase
MFAALGVRVTLVEKRAHILEFLDAEIVAALQKQMTAMGIRMLMPDVEEEIRLGDSIAVTLRSGTVLSVDAILVSSGRTARTQALGLDKIGIGLDERGRIPVNDRYQTSIAHIYAAGDVIGNPALASTSMDQARVAMVHAFDLQYRKGLPMLLPYGVYTIPECSMVGESEESLKKKEIDYVVGRTPYADLFIQTCYNYPSLSEMYKYATYDALGEQAKRRRAAAPPHG